MSSLTIKNNADQTLASELVKDFLPTDAKSKYVIFVE